MADSDQYDLGRLSGMSDVKYDFGVAESTKSAFRSAASALRGQSGSRSAAREKGSTEFKGWYSTLFESNGTQQLQDLEEIASELDRVPGLIDTMSDEARAENSRRKEARAWAERRKERNALTQGFTDFFNTDEMPDFQEKAQGSSKTAASITPKPRKEMSGTGGGGGTSSCVPENLESFASRTGGLNDSMASHPGKLESALSQFAASCSWAQLNASSLVGALTKWNAANVDEVTWATTVAGVFRDAGSNGNVPVPNSALEAALTAQGVSGGRADIQMDPPQAMGGPTTTGFSDDPVNAATGNFVEPQVDLGFMGGSASLMFGRMYNSFLAGAGAFGPGWASMTESRLIVTGSEARWVQRDGRHVVFDAMDGVWGRSQAENLWLERAEDEAGVAHLIFDNDGGRWAFNAAGVPMWEDRGPGTRVTLCHTDGRLMRLEHERGRWVELSWNDEGTRVAGALSSDGRRVGYEYDPAGRLVETHGDTATHRYEWNDAGLICRVMDADGVVEVENTYDEKRRVTSQRSAHGRVSHYSYLPGRVTVVSDADGTRANTYIHDVRGRLVGVIDAEDARQSASWDRAGNQVLVTNREGHSTVRSFDQRGHVLTEHTPSGARIEHVLDDLDRVVEVKVVNDDQVSVTRYEYRGDHRNPSTVEDPAGGLTRMEWVDGSLLSRVVDPTGVVLQMGYDERGDLVSTTNAAGNTARLERDECGRVVAAITPLGHVTRYRYDERGMCVQRTDPDGANWRYEYTAGGRLTGKVDPLGGRVEMEYTDAGDESATIDELGRRVERAVDDLGNLTRVELPDGSAWEFTFDAMSRLTSTQDVSGGVWQFGYDTDGTLSHTVDATNGVRRYETNEMTQPTAFMDDGKREEAVYDRLGRVISSVNADGSSTTTRYDLLGMPVEIIDESGAVTTIERDLAGRPVAVTQPMGATFRYEYDECGRWMATISTGGDRYEVTYDADGRICGEIWPTGERVSTEFDACGRANARREPGRGLTRIGYDKLGRVVRSQDTWYGLRRFGYDAASQMTQAINAAGGVTEFSYDDMGRVATITDPLGGVTSHAYDPMGRLLSSTDQLGRVTRYSYDAAGRATRRVDAAGQSSSWSYDSAGRVVQEWTNNELLSVTTRDFAGRTTTVVEGDTTHQMQWDVRGNLVSRSRDGRAVFWEYDANSRRTQMVRPNGVATTYEYNTNSQISAFTHEGLGRAIIDRDPLGRIVSVHADGLYASWEYTDGAVVGQRVERNGFISESVITRDTDGRVVSDRTDGIATTYRYDDAGQLIHAATSEGLVTTWTYDANGRMLTEDAAGKVTRFAYDEASQLTTMTGPEGETFYGYDQAGRRVSETGPAGERHLSWDPRGFLDAITTVSHDGDTVQSTSQRLWVDALGELAEVDGGSVWWDTASALPALIQHGQISVVAEAGVAGITGGPDAGWLPPQWAARDHGTNPMDPWAVSTNVGVSAQGSLLVQGMEWMTARVYDPATRGFLSTDPLPGVPGSGWAANPYAFAGNDPVNFCDPLGMRPVSDADLQAYQAANRSPLEKAADAAGGWMASNWEYVAAGGLALAGGVLMATGVGGPVGAMMLSAGVDGIIQKATTGEVDWGRVAVAGAAGLVGGGLGAAASKLAGSCLTKAVVGGVVDGAVSEGMMYFTGPGPHTVGGFVGAVGMGGAGGGVFAGAGQALSKVTGWAKNACFVADTQVLMADGTSTNIQDIAVGDVVGAYNPETEHIEPREVEAVFVHENVATWRVTTGDGHIDTTAAHPFYVQDQGWTPAEDLRAGDRLQTDQGNVTQVVTAAATGETATVHNFTVNQLHNYHVATEGGTWVLVHNTCRTDVVNADSAVQEQVQRMQANMTDGELGRTTYAAAHVSAPDGTDDMLVAAAGKGGYVRPGIRGDMTPVSSPYVGDAPVPHINDAERHIARAAADRGLTINAMGATRPVCDYCQTALPDINFVTPRK